MTRETYRGLIGKAIELYNEGMKVDDLLRTLKFNFAWDITRQGLYLAFKKAGVKVNRKKTFDTTELEKDLIKFD